jgi:Winged helix DNA-binding domain
MTTPHEVALLRLVAQRLAGPPWPTVAETVRRLTAVQGQDFPGALASVALRTAGGRRADVEAALDDGAVVRSWPMRGTLHLVGAEDLHWLLELLGPRVVAGAARRRERLGLAETEAERARGSAVAALAGGRRLRRQELLAALAEGGVDTSGQRGYHLLWYLSQTGTLCLGPTKDGEQLFVLLDEWVPAPRRLDREEALGELVLRFFTGHGPATVADLVRWAGLPVRDVRAGLAAVGHRLGRIDVEGTEHYLHPETPELLGACRRRARGVFLLPGFDEFVLGYADRSAVLAPGFADRIVPGNNGMFRPTVVSDGRIVGTWRHTGRGAGRSVQATPFTSFPDEVAAAIERVAADLP